jgi:hypothetical protein
MRNKILIPILLLFHSTAYAYIQVNPGEYTVAARVFQTESGAVAVFNWKNPNQLILKLTGKLAASMKSGAPAVSKIKIRVETQILGPRGSAVLLDSQSAEQNSAPDFVGNNLRPSK